MRKVAAYARVGESHDALMREKADRIRDYTALIRSHSDWVYGGVFVDTGHGHESFAALMDNCRGGMVDHVIVPSISALALRREDLFHTLMELRSLGVELEFQEEELMTDGEDGERLLTTLASFLKPSKPMKPVELPYGVGDEAEEAVVKRVFQLYLSGHSRNAIVNNMNSEAIPSPKGKAWTYCDVRRIIENPVYRDEGIIHTESWEAAANESRRRAKSYHYHSPTDSPLGGMITCGVCGSTFSRRERGKSSIWLCRNYLRNGSKVCPSKCIREALLKEILDGTGEVMENLEEIIVWPDGRIVIHASEAEYARQWRREPDTVAAASYASIAESENAENITSAKGAEEGADNGAHNRENR